MDWESTDTPFPVGIHTLYRPQKHKSKPQDYSLARFQGPQDYSFARFQGPRFQTPSCRGDQDGSEEDSSPPRSATRVHCLYSDREADGEADPEERENRGARNLTVREQESYICILEQVCNYT